MRFLIAGLGSIGRRHFRNLLALGERDIVLYRSHRSTLPDDELAGFPVETDLQAALAARPEAVIISNPTALHLEVAIPAAQAGCHLFLEKPVSHSLAGLDALQAALQAGGGQALVGYQYRFHPGLQAVDRLLRAGAIGRPLTARAVYAEYLPGMHPWEDYRRSYSARSDLGGGVVLTLCHPLDYLRWLLGEPRALWALGGQLSDLDLDVMDTAEAGLEIAGGSIASLHLDYNRRPPCHTLEITGTQGTITWDQAEVAPRVYRAETAAWETVAAPGCDGFERNQMFLDLMRHFLAVVRRQASPACSLHDGIRALEMALAIQQSAQEGRKISLL